MERPKQWSRKENISISPKRYDMKKIHKYIKRCLKGTSADVKKIKINVGLLKTGYYGLALFERKTILIDDLRYNEILLYITIFHEIFHFYFKDCNDDRYQSPDLAEKDFVERRAETSARNMLKWYIDNLNYLEEIRELISKLKIKKLTKLEKEYL